MTMGDFKVTDEIASNPSSRSDNRVRDFEYAQPLYDLAYLLEIDARVGEQKLPKYRTFALWKAAISLDGYDTIIDEWLDGTRADTELDHVPSSRIRQYLEQIREQGSITELSTLLSKPNFSRCLRLRSVRGLGPVQIADSVRFAVPNRAWLTAAETNTSLSEELIVRILDGTGTETWQAAHVIPPLLRFLSQFENALGAEFAYDLAGLTTVLGCVEGVPVVRIHEIAFPSLESGFRSAISREVMFNALLSSQPSFVALHQMGWKLELCTATGPGNFYSLQDLVAKFNVSANSISTSLKCDLHLHSNWSDGAASMTSMATSARRRGHKYIAVTDHSRSCKLQGGLGPIDWLRQSHSLRMTPPPIPVLHGIEVDILADGTLDLPQSLLSQAGIVIGSVHNNWSKSKKANTDRLIAAIESGMIDVVGHPTTALIGKPGVPSYVRLRPDVEWIEVFDACQRWDVAIEFNCFPSRFDLPLELLRKAIARRCWISFGSDAHARSHLGNIVYADHVLKEVRTSRVLNKLSKRKLEEWLHAARESRRTLRDERVSIPETLFDLRPKAPRVILKANYNRLPKVPNGSVVVGIDLTAGEKATGVAVLRGNSVETDSLMTDDELLRFITKKKPQIVSIDSPLGLPGGHEEISPESGIVRVAEHDLSSIGIPSYPALIDSMKELTLRGIRLRKIIEKLEFSPTVIESYPGAAQDILCLPRKQRGLDLLRDSLRELGITGPGLKSTSHDEIDAITAAIVGRFFEANKYVPMGIRSEAQLIVPVHPILRFETQPVICLAGRTGAGKSVVARYLAVFYGFNWVKTRELIAELLAVDARQDEQLRMFDRFVDPNMISETDLRDFGKTIFEKYKQIPLRNALLEKVSNCEGPVVVDSIRDIHDLGQDLLANRHVLVWYIDAPPSACDARTRDRAAKDPSRVAGRAPMDALSERIRFDADSIIDNSSSLEDLRWRIDDTFFASLTFSEI